MQRSAERPGPACRGGSLQRRQLLAAGLGNALEWYDFAVYGALASTLARVFFPASSGETALLQSLSVFAVGYLMRPLGSLVLGPVGDRIGRRSLLMLSVLVMAVASTLIGLLPSPDRWGSSAGGLLILLRMAQGFSLGGEYTGSITYVVERAPARWRGRLGSVPAAGSVVGLVVGSLTVALVQAALPAAALLAWGWRLPFLLAGLIALVALWLRRDLPSGEPVAPAPDLGALLASLRRDRRRILQVLAILAFEKVSFYLVFVFWVQQAASRDPAAAAGFNGLATLVQALGIPLILLAGRWADQWGPLRLMRRWCALLALLVAPAMLLLQRGQLPSLAAGLVLAGAPLMLIAGTYPALIPFLFDRRSRCTAFSLSYSLGGSLLGGTAPALAAWMLAQPGWSLGPLLYSLLLAPPALLVLSGLREGSEPRGAPIA